MILLLIFTFSLIGIMSGKLIFRKWVNHLTLYCFIWGGLTFLYELRLLPYVPVIPLAWFYIISAFLAFLLGILTVTSGRNLFSKPIIQTEQSGLAFKIFKDNGKAVKYTIIFFGVVSLFSGIQHWMVLIDKFGSIPAIFINANKIYRLTNQGEIKGIIPYISTFGYVAIFFAGIYTAYKGRFSFLSFFPFIGIIINDLASIGRAGMLLALMQFLFSFFLFRHLLKSTSEKKYKFSKKNAVIAFSVLILLLTATASFVRISRSSYENYLGSSKELRELKNNVVITPSLYLYLSSDVGVLSQYLLSEGEKTGFGQNTFLTFYGLLAKIGAVEKPVLFQKGYFIPMWTNTGTYIRELHADFGILGVLLGPYIIGFLITLLWFRFYERKSLIVFTFLVYMYLVIGFSFLVMVTRLPAWTISLFIVIIILPVLERIAEIFYYKSLVKFAK